MGIISGSIWGSFQGWGSFRGRDHFRGCTVPGDPATHSPPQKNSLSIPPPPLPGSILAICIVSSALSRVRCSQCSVKFFCLTVNLTVNSFNDRLSYNDNSQVHWNCNTTVGPRSRFLVCSVVCERRRSNA